MKHASVFLPVLLLVLSSVRDRAVVLTHDRRPIPPVYLFIFPFSVLSLKFARARRPFAQSRFFGDGYFFSGDFISFAAAGGYMRSMIGFTYDAATLPTFVTYGPATSTALL